MKMMKELLNYHRIVYLRQSRFVMPSVILLMFLFTMYTIMPAELIDCFLITGIVIFMLMIWIGISYNSSEDTVSEQIIILRIQNSSRYYITDIIFIFIIGMIFSTVSIAFPFLQNLLHDGNLYTRSVTIKDIYCSFILVQSYAFTGGAVGLFFHPRIFHNKKLSLLLALLIALISIVKTGIIEEIPALALLLKVFPPIAEITSMFSDTQYYHISQVLTAASFLLLYSLIISCLRIYALQKSCF